MLTIFRLQRKMAGRPYFELNADSRVERRLKEYLESHHSTFTVDVFKDIELYHIAIDLNVKHLIKIFVRALRSESFAKKIQFINNVPIHPIDDDVDRDLKSLIANELQFAKTQELSKHSIDPTVSPMHQHFRDVQLSILEFRRDMVPLDKHYHAPFVLISLNDDAEGYVAKYFNGNRWCRLQVNDCIGEHLATLSLHCFALVRDKLFFLDEDDCLNILHFFHKSQVLKIPLPQPVPLDVQLCVDQNRVVLLDASLTMAEVIPVEGQLMYTIKDWRKPSKREYEILKSETNLRCYDIKTKYQPGKIRVCYHNCGDRLIKINGETLCSFTIDDHRLYKERKVTENETAYDIRVDDRGDCHYVLIDREVLEEYLNRLTPPDTEQTNPSKRKLGAERRQTHKKKLGDIDNELEEMDFSNFVI